jgi:alkylhydroperoxidase family enzyme
VLDDYRTAPIGDRLRAALAALETLTLRPDAFGPADVRAARACGVSDADLIDAFNVAFIFNVMDRLADTLG